MSDPTHDPLAEGVAAVLGDAGPVVLERLSGGASRQTHLVRRSGGGGPGDRLVLQVRRPGALATTLPFAVEARLLRAAADAGVPVPAAVAAEGLDGAGPIDERSWMLTAHVDGETIARKLLRDEAYAGARSSLVADCGRAMAGVHAIDPASFPELRRTNPVDESRAIVSMLGEPHPVFELALRWLDAHRPAPVEPTVVHGDFRLGNLIVDGDGLAAVIDWELAHLGDPREDLGWICVKAWRFGAPGVVAGLGTVDELLSAYVAAGGLPVDEAALQWWMVAGTLRWGAICMVQAEAHLSGASRSVELAAIGRRVCETELDLLELLGIATPDAVAALVDAAAARPPADDGRVDLHGRPTAAELLEAVREYLDGPVREQAPGQVGFHSRVASKVLAMVERELRLGQAQTAAHAMRLAALGAGSEADLAEAIREGRLDVDTPGLTDALLATTVERLLVANPDHLDLTR